MTESAERISSKKVKLHPKPEIEENQLHISKKRKTDVTASKIKISEKKLELTLNEQVVEIIDTEIAIQNDYTPSKRSLKPVSDYVKTPFSLLKENEEESTDIPVNESEVIIPCEKIAQPDFSEQSKSASVKKGDILNSQMSAMRSFKKSPFTKINEVEDELSKKRLETKTKAELEEAVNAEGGALEAN